MNVRAVGDSITFGQYLLLGVPAWPERMGAVGRGVCGETTRQALERFPRDVQELPAEVTVLQWGHNDANCWKSDHGLPRVSLRAFHANLTEMVDRCRTVGTRPVLCTLTPTRKDPFYDFAVSYYDEEVRAVADESDVTLADVREAFDAGPIEDLLMADGIHLQEEGHELYARVVSAALAVNHRDAAPVSWTATPTNRTGRPRKVTTGAAWAGLSGSASWPSERSQ